jgi:two-component system, response regulator / RNA-binding antiterminator
MQDTVMNITLVYESHEQQNATALLLVDAGFTINQAFPLSSQWVHTSQQQPPDMLVIVVTRPNSDVLQQLKNLREQPVCPVIVIAYRAEADVTRSTILAGADTCITGRISADRIQSFIEVACIRFELTQGMQKTIHDLKEQIESLESRLNERRDIDRAKGLLMSLHKMSEDDAFNAMRRMAMDTGNKLGDIARNLISMSKVLN